MKPYWADGKLAEKEKPKEISDNEGSSEHKGGKEKKKKGKK